VRACNTNLTVLGFRVHSYDCNGIVFVSHRVSLVIEFITSEAGIRLGTFAGILALLAVWESWAPRRNREVHRHVHWSNNLGLAFINTLAIRFIAPIGAVGFAMYAEANGWGFLNVVAVPNWISVIACVIALDLAIYGQHVLFHAVPLFWRLHMVHHADMEFDFTTGLRFHTIEILLSLGIKCLAILILGAPALSVLIFEVLLNATSMFNHSNVKLPFWLDRILRLFIVTPDMHRVHHSVIRRETNSNFGFNLPWWDFLFRTYRDQPEKGHTDMIIGLAEYRDQRVEYLHWMLLLPFIRRLSIANKAKTREPISGNESTAASDRPTGGMNAKELLTMSSKNARL
jgi:sterol desaturase/sphingolipid hydroxylase (fatty acid hydroxylase superfamily)